MKIRYNILQPQQEKNVNEIIEDARNESSVLENKFNVDILNLLFDFKNKNIVVFPSERLKDKIPNDLYLFDKYFSVDDFKNYVVNEDVETFLNNINKHLSMLGKGYVVDSISPYKENLHVAFDIEDIQYELNINKKLFDNADVMKNEYISTINKKIINVFNHIRKFVKDKIRSLYCANFMFFGFDVLVNDIHNELNIYLSRLINSYSIYFDRLYVLYNDNEINNIRNQFINDINRIANHVNNLVNSLNEDSSSELDSIFSDIDNYFNGLILKYNMNVEFFDKELIKMFVKHKLKKYKIVVDIQDDDIIIENGEIKLSNSFIKKLNGFKAYIFSDERFLKNLSYKLLLNFDNIQEHILNVMMEYINENELDFCFLINDKSFSIDMLDEYEVDNNLLLNNLVIYMDKNLNVCGLVDKNYYDKYVMQKIIKEE